MMSRYDKVNACLVFLLAVSFYLFWQISKHQPALSQVNAFAEDPYDAVGSFGVQFALFTALLSGLRAFRSYQSDQILDAQKVLFTRGAYITCISISVVLVTDGSAMIRYPVVWIDLSAGYILAGLIGGMALLTLFVTWLIHRSTHTPYSSFTRNNWIKASGISIVSMLVLIFYPANWRQGISGALLTAFVGLVLFFIVVWAWGMVVAPARETLFEDFIDDLVSVYRWFKAHAGLFKVFFSAFEKICSWPFVRAVSRWLNPRKHAWNGVILLGILMGIVLALAEAMGEGGPGPRFAIVIAVFIGLEGTGVLLGYALLRQPLGLFRLDPDPGKSTPTRPSVKEAGGG